MNLCVYACKWAGHMHTSNEVIKVSSSSSSSSIALRKSIIFEVGGEREVFTTLTRARFLPCSSFSPSIPDLDCCGLGFRLRPNGCPSSTPTSVHPAGKCMSMHVCMVCKHACMYDFTCVCLPVCRSLSVCLYACMHACMYASTFYCYVYAHDSNTRIIHVHQKCQILNILCVYL